MTLASARRITALCLALTIGAVASAQDSVQHAACRDPHPAPVCGSYLVFEYMGGGRLLGTRVTTLAETRDALRSWFAVDIGVMRSASPTSSMGASFGIGGSADGSRVSVRLRRRQWLDRNLVFDLSGGPLVLASKTRGPESSSTSLGATADAGFGRARLGLVTLGADVAQQAGKTQMAMHAGARVESRGALVVTAATILAAIGLIAAIGASCESGCR
jgi:hypothetical protein